MRRRFTFLLATLLITGLIFGGCAAPAPVPAPIAPAPGPEPTTPLPIPEEEVTPPFKGVTLRFAYTMPERVTVSQGWEWWGEELEKRTDGKVKVDFYPGGTLFKLPASIDSILGGVADIAMTSIGFFSKRFPLSNVGSLPTASFPDTVEGLLGGNNGLDTLREKFPEVRAEWTDFKVLGHYQMLNYIIQSRKEIHVPADLKGLTIGGDGLKLDFAEACGAVPIVIQPPAEYMNLSRGVVDAAFLSWSHARIYKIYEVVPYFFDYGFGATSLTVIMNLDSWNAIPADIQKIMMELIPESQEISARAMIVSVDGGRKAVSDAGKTTITLTPDEVKLWQEAGKPLDDNWLAEMKAAGVKNPEEVLEEWKRLAIEARK